MHNSSYISYLNLKLPKDKVWKSGKKSSVYFKATSALEVKCFGQILFNLAHVFAAHHAKSFVPAFFYVSIDHLFDNLESEKEIIVLE